MPVSSQIILLLLIGSLTFSAVIITGGAMKLRPNLKCVIEKVKIGYKKEDGSI